jgi:phospholipase C
MARITRPEFIRKASAAAAVAAVGCGDNDGNDNQSGQPPRDFEDVLDSFDYVVVLMLENRSFDNLLGYLYPNGVPPNAPAGTTFDGVTGKNLSNPIPATATGQSAPPPGVTSIPVFPATDYHQPYPDPGEEYYHINTQLFDVIDGKDESPYNLPTPTPDPAPMNGFITDYIEQFPAGDTPNGQGPLYAQYQQIMQCFEPATVPVLATLAEQFAVFDHWYCSVPSQTWCNRAFWNAGTSWGHVVNGGSVDENSASWVADSDGETLFNKISDSGIFSPLDWLIYSSNSFDRSTAWRVRTRVRGRTRAGERQADRLLVACVRGEAPVILWV